LPIGYVLTNSINQVLIKGPPLEACHGKRLVAMAAVLTRFELGEGHRTQTGIEVKSEFGFCAGLAIAQTGKLFGVAKEKLDLKARLVIAVEPLGLQVDIRAEEHSIAVALGMDHDRHLEVALQLHRVEHLMVQHDMFIFGVESLKT